MSPAVTLFDCWLKLQERRRTRQLLQHTTKFDAKKAGGRRFFLLGGFSFYKERKTAFINKKT